MPEQVLCSHLGPGVRSRLHELIAARACPLSKPFADLIRCVVLDKYNVLLGVDFCLFKFLNQLPVVEDHRARVVCSSVNTPEEASLGRDADSQSNSLDGMREVDFVRAMLDEPALSVVIQGNDCRGVRCNYFEAFFEQRN